MSRINPILVATLLATGLPVHAEQNAALDDEARGIVKSFFSSLKGELVASLESGGPVEAIKVCNDRAPALANGERLEGRPHQSQAAQSGQRAGRLGDRGAA
jgi:hypothetical protein